MNAATKGLEVHEFTGADADDVLVSDFGALSLVPKDTDALREKMVRAGWVKPGPSERSEHRAERVL